MYTNCTFVKLDSLPSEKKYLDAMSGPVNEATPFHACENCSRKAAGPAGGIVET